MTSATENKRGSKQVIDGDGPAADTPETADMIQGANAEVAG